MKPRVKRAANIKSIFTLPLAKSIKYPSPLEDPTHSPIVAPIGAYTADNLIPEKRFGVAAGILIT